MLAGKREISQPLAGKSTLNRMELAPGGSASEHPYHKINYSEAAIDQLLVDLFLESYRTAPRQIILDLDATDMPLYGKQEERFFHGYYGHYCYLPLYIFCDDHLLCARLPSSNLDASAGSLQEVQRIVAQIRTRGPKTRIILRADSGFCREELMSCCEQHQVDYVFGLLAINCCAERSPHPCARQNSNTATLETRPGCSPSSVIAPARAGVEPDEWWPRLSKSRVKRIRAIW